MTEELKTELDAHARVVDLNREQYKIRLEIDPASARYSELQVTAERTRIADSAFKTALGDVYRDPAEARRRLILLAQTLGHSSAVATLRGDPKN
jgi:hypothetical protein